MASNLVKIHLQSLKPANPSIGSLQHNTLFFSHLPFPKSNHQNLTFNTSCHEHFHNHIIPSLSIHSSLSCSTPPSTKEEAILQAKTCLSNTLEKPLFNPKLTGKLKKLRQPRFRVEIPVVDDSPASLSQLALDVFKDLPMKRRGGSKIKFLLLWPNPKVKNSAVELFQCNSSSDNVVVEHGDLSSMDERSLGYGGDVAVFIGAESSQLGNMKTVSERVYPKAVVIFNPKWGYEEEGEFGDKFVGTFEVIYSFMGLEVRGVLSRRKGVVFKCVRDGVVSGEKWGIHVEEEGGKLELVSKFKDRPSIDEVENVLYNLMAINSPITKSAKFLRGLVSNVTGNK